MYQKIDTVKFTNLRFSNVQKDKLAISLFHPSESKHMQVRTLYHPTKIKHFSYIKRRRGIQEVDAEDKLGAQRQKVIGG